MSSSVHGERRCGGTIGLVLMGCSAISFSLMSFAIHLMSTTTSTFAIPAFELVFFRSCLGILLCVVWLKYIVEETSTIALKRSNIKLLLGGRAFLGSLAMCSNWFVYSQLPLGEATVVVFTAPIFTVVVARLYLKEMINTIQGVLLALSSVGVILVARPEFLGFPSEPKPAYQSVPRIVVFGIGLCGALGSAFTNVLVRMLVDVHSVVVVKWLMVSSLFVSLVLGTLVQTPVKPEGVGVFGGLLAIGILGFMGQMLKTQGLKWEKAGPGSMMRNLDIVFAFVFQATILNEEVHILSLLGAGLTLVSSLAIGYQKYISSRNDGNDINVQYARVEMSGSTSPIDDDDYADSFTEMEGKKKDESSPTSSSPVSSAGISPIDSIVSFDDGHFELNPFTLDTGG